MKQPHVWNGQFETVHSDMTIGTSDVICLRRSRPSWAWIWCGTTAGLRIDATDVKANAIRTAWSALIALEGIMLASPSSRIFRTVNSVGVERGRLSNGCAKHRESV